MTNRLRVTVTLIDPEGRNLNFAKFTYPVPEDGDGWDDLEDKLMDDVLTVATDD